MMLKKHSLSNRKLLARFLVPYVIILLMPILIGSFIYMETLKVVEKDTENANLVMLQQIAGTVDQRMKEMDGILNQLMINLKIQNFAHIEKPFELSNTTQLFDLRKELENYGLYNNFLLSYYVAFSRSGLIIGHEATYTFKEFFDLVLKYEEKGFVEWQNDIMAKYYKKHIMPAQVAKLSGKNYSLVSYMQSLNFSNNSNGTLLVLIDENEFKKLMGRLDVSDGGWAYIADEKDQIISAISEDHRQIQTVAIGEDTPNGVMRKEVNGSEMLITFAVSSLNGLKFVAVQPYGVVMSKVKYIRDLIFTLTSVTILLGLLAAGFWAYRNTKPVKEVMGRISQHLGREGTVGVRNEFDYIKEALNVLINDNVLLQEGIKEQKPFLTAAFYNRLLKGDFKKEEDIVKLGKHIGINLGGRYYAVGIVKLLDNSEEMSEEKLNELNKSGLFVKKLLQSTIPQELHLYDVDEEKFSLIFSFDGDSKQARLNLTELMMGIKDNLKKCGIFHVILAAGNIYDSALNISRSFSDAIRVLNISLWENNTGIVWHTEAKTQYSSYYYPEEVEKRLMNLTRSGEKDGVRKLLKEILNENLLNRKLSSDLLTLFIYDMYGTLVKLMDQISSGNEKLSEKLQALFKSRETDELELFRSGLDIFMQICDMVDEHKRSHNHCLKEQILRFVHQHSMNCNLCLSMIAEKFSLSEAYLSQFFKEQTGENFSTYLENIRMKQACSLLSDTDMGINEIAAQVGYSSSNTFCKVFKRVNGVNATNYKRNLPTEGN